MELYNARRPAGGRLAECQTTIGFAVDKPQAPVPQFGGIEHSKNDKRLYCESQHETTESLLSAHTFAKLQSFRYCDEQSSILAREPALVSEKTTPQGLNKDNLSKEHMQSYQPGHERISGAIQNTKSQDTCYVPSYQIQSHEDSPGLKSLNDVMRVTQDGVLENLTHPTVTGPISRHEDHPDDISEDTRHYSFRDDISVLARMSSEYSDTDGLYEGIDDATLTTLLEITDPIISPGQDPAVLMTTPKNSLRKRCENSLLTPQVFEGITSSGTIDDRNLATQNHPQWSGLSNGVENPSRSPEVSAAQRVTKVLPCENAIQKQQVDKSNMPAKPSWILTHRKPSKSLGSVRPFMRPPFPAGVPEKSPVQGLNSSYMVLRTCFRISEARRAGLSRAPQPSKGPDATKIQSKIPVPLIELYAFVEGSYRSGCRQCFRFVDLFFPSKPPYLSGVWEGWHYNPVFEQCGRDFLGVGGREWVYETKNHGQVNQRKMCRVIGTLTTKAESLNSEGYTRFGETSLLSPQSIRETLLIDIRSIQTATWSDVIYTKGIVMP